MRSNDPRRRVAVLAYDRLCTFEFGIAVEIFGLPRPEITQPWYTFRVCSLDPGELRATGGVAVRADAGLNVLQRAGTIVIPGWRDADERPPERLLNALRAAHARGARIVTICSGVFIVAAAGLADGRRVTTHWRYIEKLKTRYPQLTVEADVLYVHDGQLLTSAGSAAGIDACLHLVRSDYGAEIAHQVARRLVMPPQRDGGQAQYIPAAVRTKTPACGLTPTLEWMQRRLADPLPVTSLAERAAMSPRTFARRFREATGTTPHRWLVHQRIIAAQRLLETTGDSIDGIAEAVGLQTAATLRHHFTRTLSTTPTAYRHRFSKLVR